MTLVVETGAIVPGANSYVSLDDVKSFCAERNITVPDDATLETLVVKSADFINTFEWKFKGIRTDPVNQVLCWPRTNVGLNGVIVDPNTIPQGVKLANIQGAIELISTDDLSPNITDYALELEKVDVIEVRYATGGSTGGGAATEQLKPVFTKVVAYLYPLFRYGIGQFQVLRA